MLKITLLVPERMLEVAGTHPGAQKKSIPVSSDGVVKALEPLGDRSYNCFSKGAVRVLEVEEVDAEDYEDDLFAPRSADAVPDYGLVPEPEEGGILDVEPVGDGFLGEEALEPVGEPNPVDLGSWEAEPGLLEASPLEASPFEAAPVEAIPLDDPAVPAAAIGGEVLEAAVVEAVAVSDDSPLVAPAAVDFGSDDTGLFMDAGGEYDPDAQGQAVTDPADETDDAPAPPRLPQPEDRTYYVVAPRVRPRPEQIVHFVWSANATFELDSDADDHGPGQWTELSIDVKTGSGRERVDIDAIETGPLLFKVSSNVVELSARAAYALARSTQGAMSTTRGEGLVSPEEYVDHLGRKFDVAMQLRMARLAR